MILGWGELGDDDRPPVEIWLDNEELELHFERVKRRWASRGSSDSSDMEPIDEGNGASNEYTRGLRDKLKG